MIKEIGPIITDITLIINDLTDIILLFEINSTSGVTSSNLTAFFNSMAFSDRFKVKFLSEDKSTEYFAELIKWDQGVETLYVFKLPDLSSIVSNTFFFQFNEKWDDNTTFISDIGGVAGQSIYKNAYKTVQNLESDPSDSPATIGSTSNEINGTDIGDMLASDSVIGMVGNAIKLDGVSKGITFGKVINIIGDLTLEMLFKTGSLDSNGMLIGNTEADKETEAFNQNFSINIKANGTVTNAHEKNSGVNIVTTSVGSYFIPNTWYHLIWTRNATTKNHKIYVLGDLKETLGYSDNPTGGASTTLTIGYEHAINPGPQVFFEGLIDYIRISNIVEGDSYAKVQYESFFTRNLLTYPTNVGFLDGWTAKSNPDEDWSLQTNPNEDWSLQSDLEEDWSQQISVE